MYNCYDTIVYIQRAYNTSTDLGLKTEMENDLLSSVACNHRINS